MVTMRTALEDGAGEDFKAGGGDGGWGRSSQEWAGSKGLTSFLFKASRIHELAHSSL